MAAAHHVPAPLSVSQFVSDLTTAVPETAPTVQERLVDQEGELLMHLLAYNLGQLAVTWFQENRSSELTRLLEAMDIGIREGDEYLINAIAVSFVEDLPWWEADVQPLILTFPEGLRSEVFDCPCGADRARPSALWGPDQAFHTTSSKEACDYFTLATNPIWTAQNVRDESRRTLDRGTGTSRTTTGSTTSGYQCRRRRLDLDQAPVVRNSKTTPYRSAKSETRSWPA